MVQSALIAEIFDPIKIDGAKLQSLPERLKSRLREQGLSTILIGVCGSVSCPSEIGQLAFKVGAEIAERKAILVTGGRGGVMEAASRGAKSVDGFTIGLLPGSDGSDANHYLDVAVPTGWLEARNYLIPHLCDAIIAIDGEYGTSTEIAYTLKLGKPLIGLRLQELWLTDVDSVEDPAGAVEQIFGKLQKTRPKHVKLDFSPIAKAIQYEISRFQYAESLKKQDLRKAYRDLEATFRNSVRDLAEFDEMTPLQVKLFTARLSVVEDALRTLCTRYDEILGTDLKRSLLDLCKALPKIPIAEQASERLSQQAEELSNGFDDLKRALSIIHKI